MGNQKGSKNGLVVYSNKEGIHWSEFKNKYAEYLDTSAFYVIKTPISKDNTGNLVKLGISSWGSSEIIRRLSDYQSYYDGNFTVLHLRVWYKYVKNSNQNRAPQQKYELNMKRLMNEKTKPKYGTEWFDFKDLDTIFELMKIEDKKNEPIKYEPPRRNKTRQVKEISLDTLIKIDNKYGVIFYKETIDKIQYYYVLFFNKQNKININTMDILTVHDIRKGIKDFEDTTTERIINKLSTEWMKSKNISGA